MKRLRLISFCVGLATTALGADLFDSVSSVKVLRAATNSSYPTFYPEEVRLGLDAVDVLPLGGGRFVLMRPDLEPSGRICFTGVSLSIVNDSQVSIGETLPGVRVCSKAEPRSHWSRAFPALQRYAVWQAGGTAGMSGTLFDSQTHAVVTTFSAAKNYELVVPWGPSHVLAFSDPKQPLAFEVLPADGKATLKAFAGVEKSHTQDGLSMYPWHLFSSPQRLGVVNVETQQVIDFPRELFPAGKRTAMELGPFGEIVLAPGGLWFIHRRDTTLTVHQLEYSQGKAPSPIFAETGPAVGEHFVQRLPAATRLVIRSWPSPEWELLAGLFDLTDARVDELSRREQFFSSDDVRERGPAGTTLEERTERVFTWPAPVPTAHCYLLEKSYDLKSTSLQDVARTAACAWSPKVWDTVRTTTQRAQAKTPAEVADFCVRALLRGRASELSRCVDDRFEDLGPWTAQLRGELALMVTRAGGLPQPALKTRGDKTMATWSFKDDKRVRFVRLTIEPRKKGPRGALLPRTVSLVEYVDSFGETSKIP